MFNKFIIASLGFSLFATTAHADVAATETLNVSDTGVKASPEDVPISQSGGLAGIGLVAAAKVGGGLSLSHLGASPVVELELGYDLPVLDRSLEVFVSGQYLAPSTSGSNLEDDRLPQAASYKVIQQEGIFTLGGLLRFPVPVSWVRPYAGIGARLYLLRTVVHGDAGSPFGKNEETASRVGLWGAIGSEFYLGPGALVVEVAGAYSGLNGFIVRDSSTGGLSGALGYRFFI